MAGRMVPDVALPGFGEEAGRLAASPAFDLDDHRWRRFLIAMAELEESLTKSPPAMTAVRAAAKALAFFSTATIIRGAIRRGAKHGSGKF